MRALAAILKDSFREALASRVLLIALIAIVVILALIAPFGLREDKSLSLRNSEIPRPDLLIAAIADGREQELTPAARVWSLLPEDQQERIAELADPESDEAPAARGGPGRDSVRRQLLRQLNQLLEREDFYDTAAWEAVSLPDECRELTEQTDPSSTDLRRRNLLLLAAAFPRAIQIVESRSLAVTYANATVVDALPVTPSQFREFFEVGLRVVITVFLGFFGVFASLLVTAGIIPRTFEPGEISLLLSKPVRRSTLFITRFVGGCVFTLLYATVMVVGLWLLLGIRIAYWKTELLWCIPVYVLLFMIYYAVSAVAGVIWRNAIVSLSLVVCFWMTITIIGAVHDSLERDLIRARGITEIIPTDSGIIVVDGSQRTLQWNSESVQWDETFATPANPAIPEFVRRLLASNTRFLPAWDKSRQRLLALEQVPGRFGGMAPPELQAGAAADDWERMPLGRLPDVANTVLVTQRGRIILPSREAIYEYVGQTEEERQSGDFLSNLTAGLIRSGSSAFREVQPQPFAALAPEFCCAMDSQTGDLLLHSGNRLLRLTETEAGPYELAVEVTLDAESNGVMAVSGKYGVLATADGRIRVLDRETLQTALELTLPDGVVPRVCAASPDGGALAVLTHAGTVTLIDGTSGQPLNWAPPENSACTAVSFSPDGRLLVADGRLTVREYDVATRTSTGTWSQSTTWVYQVYDYIVTPLWKLLPRPSELDQFVSYVLTGERTILEGDDLGPPGMINRSSLQQERRVFDAWKVVRHNGLFVAAMLLLGCLYISRRDF